MVFFWCIYICRDPISVGQTTLQTKSHQNPSIWIVFFATSRKIPIQLEWRLLPVRAGHTQYRQEPQTRTLMHLVDPTKIRRNRVTLRLKPHANPNWLNILWYPRAAVARWWCRFEKIALSTAPRIVIPWCKTMAVESCVNIDRLASQCSLDKTTCIM